MKTIPVTINNQVRLLDAEMVEKWKKGGIALLFSWNEKDKCVGFLKHCCPTDSNAKGAYKYYWADKTGEKWRGGQTTKKTPFPISSFFVQEEAEAPSLQEQLADEINEEELEKEITPSQLEICESIFTALNDYCLDKSPRNLGLPVLDEDAVIEMVEIIVPWIVPPEKTSAMKEQLSAAVAREAKLRESLVQARKEFITSHIFYMTMATKMTMDEIESHTLNCRQVKAMDAALSDTTPPVLPAETPDKDAVFNQMYESLKFCKEVINDIQQYIEFGESAKQKFGERNEKAFNEHTFNQVMNSDNAADTALAAAAPFINKVK